MKQRIDVAMTTRGLADSREKAQALIMAGQVYIDEKKVLKASEQVAEDANIVLRGAGENHFASRGGHKLEKAITAFEADVRGAVAMDIGAATGGFTDVLLRHGAQHVYAIDVGYGQLDWKLRNDERVTVMERTNARTLTEEMFPAKPNLTVMDVSFISIRLILPVAAEIMGENGRFLTLEAPV
ncbi:MAG: TlyA family RNA methyltransferase [Clostridia bacterium]|nr:TlyA family RNA methyltransferase [Clostridia bacterium]